jgi:MFS family permease
MNTIVRTAIAILCGFLAMTLIVLSGTVVASSTLLADGMRGLSDPDAPLPALYLGANQLLSLVAATLGGWLASRLDPKGGWRPVIGLLALVVIMSVANQAVPRGSTGAPVPWYPWLLVLAGGAGTVLGGWLRLRERERRVAWDEPSTSGAIQS